MNYAHFCLIQDRRKKTTDIHNDTCTRKNSDQRKYFIKNVVLLNENNKQWENYRKNKSSISEAEINSKIDLRNKARANKDYKEADRIRDELFNKGVLIEDKDGKTFWKFK